MKAHEYKYIYWDPDNKRFIAVADLKLGSRSSGKSERRHYIIVRGNTKEKFNAVTHVQLTDSGLTHAIANFKNPRMKLITEYQIRTFYPELDLDMVDELVDKKALFVRLSV